MPDIQTAIESKLDGLDGVLERLRSFPVKLQAGGLRKSVAKGAAIVRRAARANAKKLDDRDTPEAIYKNVTVQFSARQSKQQGGVVLRVGVLGGARRYGNTVQNRRKSRVGATYKTAGDDGNPGGDTWYWRFKEFGTARMGATPFMRPALENNIEPATSAIVAELNVQIDRIAAQR